MIPSIPDFKNLPLRDEGIAQVTGIITGMTTPDKCATIVAQNFSALRLERNLR